MTFEVLSEGGASSPVGGRVITGFGISPAVVAAQDRVAVWRGRSALFDQAMADVEGTCGRMLLFLARPPGGDGPVVGATEAMGSVADHHWAWIWGSALVCVSQLYEAEECVELKRIWRECHGASAVEAFDPPGRYAVIGAASVGKSVLCTAFMAQVADRYGKGGCTGEGLRGVVYCASTIQMLAEMKERLLLMGVSPADFGIRYTDTEAKYRDLIGQPSISVEEMTDYPLLLVTQEQVNKASREAVKVPPQRKGEDARQVASLPDLLTYQGCRRTGLWDEAFASYGTRSFDLTYLKTAVQVAEDQLAESEEELVAAAELRACYEVLASSRFVTGRRLESIQASHFIHLSRAAACGAKSLVNRMKKKNEGPAAALKVLLDMQGTVVRCWAVPGEVKSRKSVDPNAHRTAGRTVHLVQPTAQVDITVDRLLVFDASYVISAVRSDSSVTVAGPLKLFDDTGEGGCLVPKRFDTVRIHLIRGQYGRTNLEAERSKREELIRRQVQRIKDYVPEDQPFLVATFKTRDAVGRERPPNWVEEIKAGLKARNIPNWESRARFVTYGQERGLNQWSDCRYGFGIGMLQRQWSADLRFLRMALSRRMHNPVPLGVGERPMDSVAGEMASVIQQLVSRLNCRNSFLMPHPGGLGVFPWSLAGDAEFWLEVYEPGTSAQVDAEKSELCRLLRQVMPGVQIMNSPMPAWLERAGAAVVEGADRKREEQAAQRRGESLQQRVTDTVMAWIDAQGPEVYELRTEQINQALLRRLPALVDSKKTMQRGVDAAKALLAERTEGRWRMAGRRTWVRAGPQ